MNQEVLAALEILQAQIDRSLFDKFFTGKWYQESVADEVLMFFEQNLLFFTWKKTQPIKLHVNL